MMILAIFTEAAVPKENLEPIVNIYRLDTSALVIEDADMTEVGAGQYTYDFTTWDKTLDYSVICDSVTLTGSERYAFSSIPADKLQTGVIDVQDNYKADLTAISELIDELHKLQGLDISNPMTVTPTSREAGSITQEITGDGIVSTTVTRT